MSMSKTKAGATLVGLGLILGTVGGWLQGVIEPMTAITALCTEIGGVLAIYGIRDWNIINGIKNK